MNKKIELFALFKNVQIKNEGKNFNLFYKGEESLKHKGYE